MTDMLSVAFTNKGGGVAAVGTFLLAFWKVRGGGSVQPTY